MRVHAPVILSVVALAAIAAGPVTGADTGGADADAPAPLVCAESAYAPPLALDGFSGLVTAPNGFTDSASTDLYFTVDLGPDAYADTTGTIDGELSWTVVANDYDLTVGGNASENYQPIDPAVENASASVAHCEIVSVSAIDFLAPVTVEDLQLDVSVIRTN